MFAKGAYIRGSLEQLAKKQTPRTQKRIFPDGRELQSTELSTSGDWLRLVEPIAQTIRRGDRYVFFDGHVLPANSGPIKFDGLVRSHDLPDLPHLSESLMEETLANPDYWAAIG